MQQQGVEEAQAIRTGRQAEEGGTLAQQNTFGEIITGQNVSVRKNSTGAEVLRPRLNLIEGANVAVTLADDPVNSEADITLALIANPDVTTLKAVGTKVIGSQGAAVVDVASPDATDLASAILVANEAKAQLNALLARVRASTGHGLIA